MSDGSADEGVRPLRAAEDHETEVSHGHAASEATPLLPTDLPPEFAPERSVRVLVTIVGALALTLVGVGQRLFGPALQEIMEDVICRGVHTDHKLNLISSPDNRCKDNDVQKILSMVSALDLSAEMAVPILVQIPYGIIADKYGRRIVMFLSLLGCVVKLSWTITVLSFPDRFNIWAILGGNLAYFVGGGGTMSAAMCYTLFSDVTPAADRTMVFYQINALFRIVGVAASPLGAFLLSVNPWACVWSGMGLFMLATVSVLLLPETLNLRKMADKARPDGVHAEFVAPVQVQVRVSAASAFKRAVASAKSDFSHIWRYLLGSKRIMMLMLCNALVFPMKLVLDSDVTQYMTKRYHWTWSTAAYVVSIENFVAMGVLMVVLPAISWVLIRQGRSPLQRDLFLIRVSSVFGFVGTLLLSFSPVGWVCIVALIVYSFAAGFGPLFRSILSNIVEPHTMGALNTVISTVESTMGLISAPSVAWLLNRGMDLGGAWIGLPFMFLALLGAISMMGTFMFKFPAAFS